MSKEIAIINAEFHEVSRPRASEEDLLAVVAKWMDRHHGIPSEMLYRCEHLDAYAFTKVCKRQIAAAALELIGELELARKVGG